MDRNEIDKLNDHSTTWGDILMGFSYAIAFVIGIILLFEGCNELFSLLYPFN